MKINIVFENGISDDELLLLQAIQRGGKAVITYEKYPPITPFEFARKHGVSPSKIVNRLRHPDCPGLVGSFERGRHSGVVAFAPTETVTEFLLQS